MTELNLTEEPLPSQSDFTLKRDIQGTNRVRLYDISSDSAKSFNKETIANHTHKNELYNVAYLVRKRILSNGESIVTNAGGPKFVPYETKSLQDGLLPFLNEEWLTLAQKAYDTELEYNRQRVDFYLNNPTASPLDFESDAKKIPGENRTKHIQTLLRYWLSIGHPRTTIGHADLKTLLEAVFENLFDTWQNSGSEIPINLQSRLKALEDAAKIIVKDIGKDISKNKRLEPDSYFFSSGFKVSGVSIPLCHGVAQIFNFNSHFSKEKENGTFKQFVGDQQRDGFSRLLLRRVSELLNQELPKGYECSRGSVGTYFDVNRNYPALEQRLSYWISK